MSKNYLDRTSHCGTTAVSRGPRAPRAGRALAMLAAATVALSGLGLGQPTPALADAPPQQTWAFNSPSGTDPQVPQGLSEAQNPNDVTTATTLSADPVAAQYGGVTLLTAAVELDGPINLSGKPLYFDSDGVNVATGVLLYIGEGRFGAFALLTTELGAGTQALTARFDGVTDSDPMTADAFPSTSDPIEVTIAQAPTTTSITSAPTTTEAFAPVDVTAQVASSVSGFTGNAVLLADGAPLMYVDLATDGTVLFDDAVIPWGTAELTVAYLGDADGNFAMSTSQAAPMSVTAIETRTRLEVSAPEVRADQAATFTATVTNAGTSATIDPRGAVEFLVDGEVVATASAGQDVDPETGDAEARFEVDVTDLLLGEHEVTARFVPAPGFAGSASAAVALRVLGVETTLVPSATRVQGTVAQPAVVDLTASEVGVQLGRMARGSGAGAPADGYVQAFLGAEPLGDPAIITDGAGRVVLTGLGVGVHKVELRFTPETEGRLKSWAVVEVTVLEAAAGGGGTGPTTLSKTGGAPSTAPIALGAAMLLLGVGVLAFGLRRRMAWS